MDDQDHQKINPSGSDSGKSRFSKDLIGKISKNPPGVMPDNFQTRLTPFLFLVITIGGIFLAEIIAMTILIKFNTLPYFLQTLLDASIMIILIFPLVYYLSLRPLIIHIEKRKQAEAELLRSEERFVKAFHFNPGALSITRLEDGTFIDVNDSFLAIYGSTREDVIGKTSIELGMFANSDEREKVIQETVRMHLASHPGIRDHEMETRVNSGENRIVLISTEEINLDNEACILTSISDITERKRAETRLRRANYALSVLKGCNQILVHSENEGEMIQRMCDIIVNVGEYKMAWVGFSEQDSDWSVQPVAQSGFENGYLDLVNITWADNDRGRGPTGTAIREAVTKVNQDFLNNPMMEPWRASAISRGYQSSIALPLLNDGSAFGALTIYSAVPNAFDPEEENLLIELANDLAFGIITMRVRAEHIHAEATIRQLSSIVEQTEDIVMVTDPRGTIEYVNPSFERLTGYTKEEVIGKTSNFLKSGKHDNQFYQGLWNTILKGNVFQSEIANCKKNGELFYEVITITPLRDTKSNITHFVATGKNITEHKIDEEKLRKSYDELEIRVHERTEEFREAISMLEREIDDRKQVELALQLSEKTLKHAQSVANLGNWTWSIESGEITWSDEMYRIFGIDKNSYTKRLGNAIANVVHPDDLHLVLPSNAQSFVEKKPIEYRIILPDKSIHHIWAKSGETIIDNNGKPIFLTGIAQDITERKLAEEALIKSEERYRSLFNGMTEGFALHEIICDEDGLPCDYRFIEINPAFERLTGLRQENVVGKLVTEVLPDTEPYWVQAYGQVALTGQPAHFENFSAALNRHYEVFVYSPAPRQFAVLFMDVSERQRVEELLQQQNKELIAARAEGENERRRLEAMMEALPVGVAINDACGSTLKVNHAYDLIWGENRPLKRSSADTISYQASWAETGKPVAPDEWASAQVIQKGAPVIGQLMDIRRFDDTHAIVINSAAPIRDSEGAIIGSVVAIQDITDLRRAEQLLRKAHDELELRVQERTAELAEKNNELSNEIKERKEVERQLRIQSTAMESAANGILITDPQGNIQWLNSAITQISGYSARELLGQSTRIFNSGRQDAGFYSQMWKTILSGQVWRGEVTNRRKEGSFYIEDQTITPVRDQDDQILNFISIKQDITERKLAESELEQRNMELRALSRAEQEERQLAEALVKAAMILNKSLKLDDVLAHILEQIKDVIPYQLADIMLLEGKTFYDASHQGDLSWPKFSVSSKTRFLLDDFPVMKKMVKTGRPALILNTNNKRDWCQFMGLAWSQSFLSAPLLVDEKVIGFVNLFAQEPNFFTQKMCDRLVAFATHAAVAIQNAWLFEQVRSTSERLHGLSRRLVEVQENERRYISRELHDEAGQWLTSLMVDLRLLEKNASQPAVVTKLIGEMKEALNRVLENLHRVAMSLRPASLDHLGLIAALNQHVATLRGKHDLKISFSSADIQTRLPATVETVLYRIVQEALTNVVRHAHATQAEVVLLERDNKLILIIEDDGVGFDPNTIIGDDHLGLFGMRERAEMIDGTLVIESAPGKGTTVMVEVNYDNTFASGG